MFCLLPIKQLFIAHFQKNTPLRLVLALVIAFMMLAGLLALASPQTLPAKYKNSQSIIFEAIRRVEVLSSSILLIRSCGLFFLEKLHFITKDRNFSSGRATSLLFYSPKYPHFWFVLWELFPDYFIWPLKLKWSFLLFLSKHGVSLFFSFKGTKNKANSLTANAHHWKYENMIIHWASVS